MPNQPSISWRILLIPLCALAACPPARAQEAPKPTLSPQQVRLNVESFDVVWTTIRDKHFDAKLNGVDWKQVHDELRPRIEHAGSMAEARKILQQMVERLNQSHFSIIPREVYGAMGIEGRNDARGSGQSGLQVRVIDGRAVATVVDPGSPAASAGIKPGWIIVKAGGELLEPAIAKVAKAFRSSTQREFRLALAAGSRIKGKAGDQVPLELLDGNDKPVKVSLTLAAPKGVPARFGNLPTFYVEFETRPIEKSILYIRLNAFFDLLGVLKSFGESIKTHLDAEGLVLDLRGNPGGIGGMAMGMGGWLVSSPNLKLGTLLTRDSRFNFILNPRPASYSGPVAILIDGCSVSTSEILAGGLRDIGRARTFGTRSAARRAAFDSDQATQRECLSVRFCQLHQSGGRPLEGVGVPADTEVPLTRKALLEGRDPALEAAIAWIHARKRQS